MKVIFLAILGASVILFHLSCAKTQEAPASDACEKLSIKKQELLALTKDKSCASAQDCKSAAYGQRSCGGPADYLIYSTKTVDSNQLSTKITEYNSLQQECAKTANGTAGPCVIAVEPNLSCLIGICTDTNP